MMIERPSWMTQACPPWCSGDHSGQEHPEDRVHVSAEVVVPLILRRVEEDVEGGVNVAATAVDVTIAAAQRVDEDDVWIVLASEEHELEVSLESMHRLHRRLSDLLRCTASTC